jgi:hypothetical protein
MGGLVGSGWSSLFFGGHLVSSLPRDYWAALALLATASHRYREATGRHVVIVGGAAVSFYTQGRFLSGDFDIVGDIGFEEFLLPEGFRRENRPCRLRRGYYHPDVPRLGFELVSGALFDGRSDRDKLLVAPISGDNEVVFPAVEDLIADRLGQYAASLNRDREMLEQAKIMLSLALDYDRDYLKRRIVEETGDPAEIGIM